MGKGKKEQERSTIQIYIIIEPMKKWVWGLIYGNQNFETLKLM